MVVAEGYAPLTYQWRKNGVPLSDGGDISGAREAVERAGAKAASTRTVIYKGWHPV